MLKRNSRPTQKASTDPNVVAHRTVEAIIQSEDTSSQINDPALVSKIMSDMGTKGGKIGGKRRMETMTPEERSRVALGAARVRWAKHKKPKKNR